MNINTRIYLKKRFKWYYSKHRVDAPDDIEKREFGVGNLEKKIASRHKQFKSGHELWNYLQLDAPFYISYSVAYYEFPRNPMETKNWLGADLVFDIDIPMDFINYKGTEKAKNETQKLLEFLSDDFGFKDKDLRVNFSGNKGYHIHVCASGILKLGKDERREIIDHVTGTGLDLDAFIKLEEAEEGIVMSGRGEKWYGGMRVGPKINDVGWGGRLCRGTIDYIKNSNIKKKEKIIKQLEVGNWEGVKGLRINTYKRIIRKMAVELTGDTDKMVTIDTSRLIRLPNSLHGTSGLVAMKTKDLEGFDPLNDAVAFPDNPVKVKVTRNTKSFEMKNQTHGPFDKDETLEIPEYAGIYLMLKDYAEVVR